MRALQITTIALLIFATANAAFAARVEPRKRQLGDGDPASAQFHDEKPNDSVRAEHWSGLDFGAGTVFPSLYGVALGFNFGNDARVSVGVGNFVHWLTYGIDSKYFLADGNWAPYMGVGLSYMVGEHAQYLIWDFQFDRAFVPYFQGGIDYQSDIGVHVMFNVAGSAPNGRVIVLPGIALGWYF